MQDHGYIALYRAVFGHRLFKDERPVTRLHAWAWLIAKAAWAPKQERVGRAIATLDRGQLAVTLRELGTAWGWSLGKVRRFLDTLRREAMIRTLVLGTTGGTQAGTLSATAYTIITICNYSSFQNPSTGKETEPTRKPARRPTRGAQQVLDLDEEIPPQSDNHPIKKQKEVDKVGEREIRGKMGRNKPRHGQRSLKNGTVWIDNGTPDWELYAADYKEVTGTYPLPQQYIGGTGRWFNILGEAAARSRTAGGRRA